MKSLSSKSAIFAAILLVIIVIKPWQAAGQGNDTMVTTISAASFDPVAPIAPGSIVAGFGTDLAKDTESAKTQPLPPSLAGTTVKVKDSAGAERLAPLFFVSPSQVNYLIPPETATGAAMVTVTNRDGKVSTGAAQIAGAAPGIFSANSTGKGVPAATALRSKSDGSQAFELISRYDAEAKIFVPIPIEPPKTGESVFLILFLTGMGNAASAVKVLFGVESLTPAYSGPAPGLAGLDQINIEIPGALFGRGRVNLTIVAGGLASNTVEIETGCPPGNAPPRVSGPSQSVLVGDQMTITGSGFDTDAAKNLVRIRGVEAKVLSATAEQLVIRAPYGVESGPLSVCTPRGEGRSANNVSVRTSVSGFVEDTRRQPLAGVTVRLRKDALETKTDTEGSFILADTSESSQHIIEFDGTKLPSPYPEVLLRPLPVRNKRDNTFTRPIWLQQNSGPSLAVGAPTQSNSTGILAAAAPAQQPSGGVVQTPEGFVFEVAGGTRATFPDGSTSGRLTLTAVEDSRTPVALPPGFFSLSVAQIAPFNVRLSPGAKLTFPNDDKLPPGSQARLFRLDQDPRSLRIGSFIEVGVAIVSADGKTVATAPNAITDTSIYFVAAKRSTTTLVGRVVDSDGETRVQLARVQSSGQEAFTDGAGGFVLSNLVANEGDLLTVDASFQRASGRVDRVGTISGIRPIVGGITPIGDLKLSPEVGNRKPTILAPASLAININEKLELPIVVSDPDPNQIVTVTPSGSGANFATLTPSGNNLYLLKLMPGAGDGGGKTLALTAQDNEGAFRRHEIKLKVNHLPVAIRPDVVTLDEDASRAITLTGSDSDGDSLIFFIVQHPANGKLSGDAPNLTYRPNPNYFGPDRFTFKVSDGVGESAPEQVTIAVMPVNDRPSLMNVPGPQVIKEGENLSFIVTALDVDEGDRLSFSATGLPAGANFTPVNTTSAEFRWTPSFNQAGTETVTFTVNDNSSMPMTCCDSKTVMITVNNVNRPPVLTVPGPQMVNSGQNLSFSITATDPDDGQTQTLTFSAMNLPDGAKFNPVNRQFSWTPRFLQVGSYDLRFKATDIGPPPNSDEKTVTVTVKGQWAKAGLLEGGQINAIFAQGTLMLAGTEGGGIFRSSDQGSSWTQVFPNGQVRAFAASDTTPTPSMIFAGTFDGGVFRSNDQGRSWTFAGSPGPSTQALAVSGTTLFAGTFYGGVFRSTDWGATWTVVNKGLTTLDVRALLVNGADLFAGTDSSGVNPGGVFRSTDLGANWTAVSSGLPDKSSIHALAVSGSTFYAGSYGGGVFKSTNNGQSWTAVPTVPPMAGQFLINSLFVSGVNLVAGTSDGVYLSSDNGQTLAPINTGAVTSVLSAIVSGTTIFSGLDGGGVFRSTNSGQSWAGANSGLTAMVIPALIASGPNLLAGTRGGGIFRSTDGGGSWRQADQGLPPYQSISGFVALSDMTLFAGTGYNGVFRSTDQGQSWTQVNENLPNGFVVALGVSGENLFVSLYAGVFRSTNRGQNWAPANSGLEGQLVQSFAAIGQTLFAGANGGGVFLSSNNGGSWTQVNSGLEDKNVLALAVNGAFLYAGTSGGVFRSSDQGNSWEAINDGLTNRGVRALIVDETRMNLFAGTEGGGVFLLPGNGRIWQPINQGFTTSYVRSFAIGGGRIFAGTTGGGVFAGQ